jgi:hypothetical protein
MNEPTTIGTSDERKRVFIVGCPRSGSTWVSLLLAQHPEIAVFQHSKFMQYLRSLKVWWAKKDQGFGKLVVAFDDLDGCREVSEAHPPVRFGKILSEAQCDELCRTAAETVFEAVANTKPGARVVVDKTPECGHIAKFILKIFPDAYFLHVVRDPRSVSSSLRSAGISWAKGEFPTKAIDSAEFWRYQVRVGLKVSTLTPRYMQVRYEDLQVSGVDQLKAIFEFLGLTTTDELCAAAFDNCRIDKMKKDRSMPDGFFRKGELASWRGELSTRDVRLIEYITADLMTQLKYEPSLAPYQRKPIRLWLHERCGNVGRSLYQRVKRKLHRLYTKWKGRYPQPIPEHVVY